MASNPVLTTSRYTEPSVYLGEIITPEAGNLSADARIPAIVAKGDRRAIARNQGLRRAFILAEQLAFSTSPPYVAPLAKIAMGQIGVPNQIFKQDGTQVRADKWQYILVSGQYTQVQISDDVFDPTATYFIDYQSVDRSVRDQLPIQQIREMRAVGNQLDRPQYVEYRDYYIPTQTVAPVGDQDNVNPDPGFSPIIQNLQPGSTGLMTYGSANAYEHLYDRHYFLTCTAISGAAPNRTATFEWSAALMSPGDNVAAPVPLTALDAKPSFTVDEATPASLTQGLEFGISLDFAFGATQFVVGDEFSFSGLGPSLVEIDPRYSNPQFSHITAPVLVSGTANDLNLYVDPNANYLLLRNNKYRLILDQVAGSAPNRQLTFHWVRYGESPVATGAFTVLENNVASHSQVLANGVRLAFAIGTTDAIPGVIWEVSATAPRIYYSAKDSRNYKLTVSGVTSPSPNNTLISGGFSTDTTEGRFGVFQAQYDSATGSPDGYVVLPDQMNIAFRNVDRFADGDAFEFSIAVREEIDWSLDIKVEDVKEVTDYQTDVNGNITGTAGQKYVTLTNVPSDPTSIRVQNINNGNDISFNFITNSPFIFFNTDPGVPLRISYQTRGQEPDPGQVYYVTAAFLRPDSAYNVPFLALRLEDGQNFAAPSTTQNDLYIGNQIAWDNNAQAVYLIQPKNVDGSGTYTTTDFQAAIRSVRDYDRITDLCLLNYINALPEVLNENVLANDPFEKRPNLVWVGVPIGTQIGDDNTDGSMVFMSKRTLQVRGDSAARGTRIMVGNNRCTKDVVLDDGTTATVTLDGSFLALAMAARVASFADPATDVLRTQVNGFASIDIYTDPENKLLGGAAINYIKGSAGAYFWAEDITVDTGKNFDRIQLMTQRQFVVKVVVREMDVLIGITPSSSEAGRQLVRGLLASILRGLLARGLIGQYQDEEGNERSFDPDEDIVVFADRNDPSLYYFNFAWFSRNVIKRLFGLYALNSNDFSVGVPLR